MGKKKKKRKILKYRIGQLLTIGCWLTRDELSVARDAVNWVKFHVYVGCREGIFASMHLKHLKLNDLAKQKFTIHS